MSEENLELARAGFEARNRSDFDALEGMVTADFEFIPAIAAGVEGGSIRGRDEVRKFFETLDETWESFNVDGDEFREVGNQVLVLGRVRAKGRGSGLELDQPMTNVMWFRDGKIARMQSFLDHDAAIAAASTELAR